MFAARSLGSRATASYLEATNMPSRLLARVVSVGRSKREKNQGRYEPTNECNEMKARKTKSYEIAFFVFAFSRH
jgi:hypothetical protein